MVRMHKHQMKFDKAAPHFLFFHCVLCGMKYMTKRSEYTDRFRARTVI